MFREDHPTMTKFDDADSRPTSGVHSTQMERGRVLVVDDELLVMDAIKRVLLKEHDVTGASNLEQAMVRLGEGFFDVVLCDVHLGPESGFDLWERVAQVHPEQAGRFVFLSGEELDCWPEEALGVLRKPFALAELRAVVRAAVSNQRPVRVAL